VLLREDLALLAPRAAVEAGMVETVRDGLGRNHGASVAVETVATEGRVELLRFVPR
jgi:hypothetical protein